MRTIAVALASVALVACSGGDNEDLRQWMNEVSKDVKGNIPPLPQVKPYEPVAYDAGNLIDPFKPAKIGPEQRKGGGGGLQPDMDRPREPLESYPLESLKYVGVMSRKKVSFAIILVDGALYQVRVGNYMGQNFGVITKITDSELTLKELIQDSAGDWVERESSLLLQGQEGIK
ncbi:pilus assembly protein PilP [Propionivibrio sp.]|uniref:pilus assembly protein PilP n=1 Tax=Propionivibrio sp. TaxID=2212460 RepID=UPI0025E17A9A|nr:pilus assembly protein PilP [Propionivibrio sp.]MBK7355037.1 pilus assembly protein PilP [Propionivibrio sp.]MBK8402407.1 pilus assembly protein PilP [Propionivibrio sp.]MBK8743561.1 pilus assembly protein PilP [Propionivibrio sp.]MBK8892865.1 pilus assembly protein PilP [Propionivibrio sp.]MBL0206472.1 pilus assembly protein PilP [Propionivibrio sp.]